jgi:hypothetical protein
VSDIEGEVSRVRDALDRPTLQLLDRKWAAVALPIFVCTFSQDVRSVRAERLHAQVDAYLDELRLSGHSVPAGTGKALCVQWVRQQWLYREPGDDGQEQYRLTSHTQDALNIVEEMTRERSFLSGSRITTIMETVARVATDANPDRQDRIDRLDEQIAALSAERERLHNGGVLHATSENDLVSGFVEVLRNLDGLPGDFKRVEESVSTMHKQILRNFRDEERLIGDVVADYLTKSRNLLKTTPEGQAFEGAFELLRNKDWLTRLKRDVDTILDHPYAGTLLPDEQKRMRGTVELINQGISDVLSQRKRLSATLRERIENYDQIKNRELDQVLRGIDRELRGWMQEAKSRSAVEVELLPSSLEVEHLRTRLFDTDSERAPEPLEDVSADAPPPLSLAELRQQGGPSLADLRTQLETAMGAGDVATAAALFNDLPVDLRRPVELLGLMHLLSGMDVPLTSTDDRELVEAVRPDGSRRDFLMPNVSLTTAAAQAEYGEPS